MDIAQLVIAGAAFLAGSKALKEAFKEEPHLARSPVSWDRLPGLPNLPEANGPRSQVRRVANIDQRVRYVIQQIIKGRRDPRIRGLAVKIVSQKCNGGWCIPERDYLGEIRAIFKYTRQNVRYVRDPIDRDTFQHPVRTLEWGGEDCFPTGTMMLRDDMALVNVEDLKSGDRIWGLDRWSTVQRKWFKGILPVTVITLNNGSQIKLTEDHDVTVYHCSRHENRSPGVQACSCPTNEREPRKIRVSDLEPGMVLPHPDRIPFGKGEMDSDRAWIEGVFIADGWVNHDHAERGRDDIYRFAISGQDGSPKEEQKKKVKEICDRLGIPTRWHRKYIAVNDQEWALRMAEMGHRAVNKHALSLDLSEGPAASLLRGILADASTRERDQALTTTSRLLAVQARILLKMFGRTAGWAFIENHGGLGEHPIYRLFIRERERANGKREKLLRVKSIAREIMSLPCYDITTDDHWVYLPEHDVTVNQCDGATIVMGALLGAVGYPYKCRVIQTKQGEDFDHIYGLVGVPPTGVKIWLPVDASVSQPCFWEAPKHMVKRVRDFPVP